MQDYVIAHCVHTYEFMQWANLDGLSVWIPLAREVRDGKMHVVAALPGYAFVRSGDWSGVLRDAPAKYRVRPMGYDAHDQLLCCRRVELDRMQFALNGATEPVQHGLSVRIGDWVRITAGPFEGWEGRVHRVRDHQIRALYGKQFISTPPQIIERA